MFHYINSFVSEQFFALQSWNNFVGQGVWVALGSDDDEVDFFRSLYLSSKNGEYDDFLDIAQNLVLSTNWLPYILGESMIDAMVELESRLAALPREERIRESDWTDLVICAAKDLQLMHSGVAGNVEMVFPTVLNKPFDEALQILTDRYGPWPRWNSLHK